MLRGHTESVKAQNQERFHANVGVVMVVHVGLATLLAACRRWEGTLGQTRLSRIAEALQAQING
jgi:hypothetical protein